ncbi:MAG TPA: hypothetical protein PLX25_08270 [Sphaerochaeta sp.]|jgi:hypothetical protein|nr:hypothetical protein [Sphaerochaeta sp.]HPZ16647.1 hypothetical protein [Sphaerochaeta sp.]
MNRDTQPLPPWYDELLSSPPKMLAFFLVVIVASPIILLFGATMPLFRKYL